MSLFTEALIAVDEAMAMMLMAPVTVTVMVTVGTFYLLCATSQALR